MEEKTLVQLVGEICGDAVKGEHRVKEADSVSVLLNVGGSMEQVQGVRQIRVGKGYLVAATKEGAFHIGLGHIMGFKVHKGGHGSAGF